MFLNFSEKLECPHVPKLPLLRCQNFLRFFLPFRSVGFCLRALGPRAAAPEARHRCTTQPRTAAFPPSRGSSRPRQRWMPRRTTAVASGRRIWGRKTFLRQWELYMRRWMKCWWFKVLVDFCFDFLWKVSVKTCAPPFCFVLCGHDISRLCPLSTLSFFFCGPSLGSDFAPEFWEVSSVHHSNVASALLQVW